MRAVVIADTHNQHSLIKLPKGDMLIHAGDACGFGNAAELSKFATWFRQQQFKHKIFVAGNHDRECERLGVTGTQDLFGPEVHYLQDTMVDIEGYKIYGTPWQPPFCNWAFNLEEEKMALAFDLIPEYLDILITHGPPKGVGDKISGENIGSRALLAKLIRLDLQARPAFHVFGHCHNGYGVCTGPAGTVFANAAQCDEQYRVVNPPIVLNVY